MNPQLVVSNRTDKEAHLVVRPADDLTLCGHPTERMRALPRSDERKVHGGCHEMVAALVLLVNPRTGPDGWSPCGCYYCEDMRARGGRP